MASVLETVNAFPDSLAPLKEAANRYMPYSSQISGDGLVQIGHRPWIAPKNYLLTIFPGLTDSQIKQYQLTFKIEIPPVYTAVLKNIGGAFCFGLSLYGLPRSMLNRPPLLDRSVIQCHDLAMAATHWVHEFNVAEDFFHFGDRHFSRTDNVGFFFDAHECVYSVLKGGTIVSQWDNFSEFLEQELQASETLENELHPHEWGR